MDQEAAVALVRARQASSYGIMAAGRLGLDLARQGALVVSGMAQGVDAAALRGALQGGGRVVSVLGSGIDVIYPAGHGDLYEDVAAAGALLSEYPPGTPPAGPHFPVRNRLIAGLSLGVLVVEGSQTSGALITARWALEQGRDVFAVPGGIDAPLSQGPNGLIRRGEAKLIQDAWDVVEEYAALYPDKLHPKTPLAPGAARARLEGRESPPPAPPQQKELAPARLVVDLGKDPEALTDDQAALLRALQARGEQSADDLVEATGIPARRVLSALTLLQVRQWVAEAGRRFTTPGGAERRTYPSPQGMRPWAGTAGPAPLNPAGPLCRRRETPGTGRTEIRRESCGESKLSNRRVTGQSENHWKYLGPTYQVLASMGMSGTCPRARWGWTWRPGV